MNSDPRGASQTPFCRFRVFGFCRIGGGFVVSEAVLSFALSWSLFNLCSSPFILFFLFIGSFLCFVFFILYYFIPSTSNCTVVLCLVLRILCGSFNLVWFPFEAPVLLALALFEFLLIWGREFSWDCLVWGVFQRARPMLCECVWVGVVGCMFVFILSGERS